MMQPEQATASSGLQKFREELAYCWREMPDKGLFFALLLLWVALFQFLGNSTFGYGGTPSLFYWLNGMYLGDPDNEHGFFLPFIVLALFWWKRKELLVIPKNIWWPGFLVLGLALALHLIGYMVQQARISVVGFFLGVYALLGLVWGVQMLRASFFPFFLFAFCLPLSGGPAEKITFPLRMMATRITTLFSQYVLGINVIQDGTRIFDPSGNYQYEVAAACSGMRSLTATLALALIYAFLMLKTPWKRLLLVAATIPLAVVANVFRLSSIILASESFGGQRAGNYVHQSSWMSILPYIPAIGGILLLGHWLGEDKVAPSQTGPALQGLEQKL